MSPKCVLCAVCVALSGSSLVVHAGNEDRTIIVLLKDMPGAPTPAEVVDYTNTWPHAANPPLQAFLVKDPELSVYLLPDRATGDFLTWLNANPNSARRKLENILLSVFPSPADVPEALAALQADPFVETADVPADLSFHTTAVSGGVVDESPNTVESTMYGWDDMNLDAAWQITGGGYAHVAQIDMGADRTHPALLAFAGNTYVGGNLMLGASKDIGLTGQPAQPAFDQGDIDEGKPEWIGAGMCTPVDAFLPPAVLGHGTHTAGLLGANESAGDGLRGVLVFDAFCSGQTEKSQ